MEESGHISSTERAEFWAGAVDWQSVARRHSNECDEWRGLALHALHDLRLLGVPVEKIAGMTPDVLEQLADYDRDMTSYS